MDALPPPSSPTPRADIQKLRSTLSLQLSRFNDNIARLNRLLSSTPALDTLLCTTTYTLTLLSAFLPPSPSTPSPSLSSSSKLKARIIPASSRTARLRTTLPPLLSLLSDLRIALRLWSLLSIYSFLIQTLTAPPTDPVLRLTAYAQVVSSAAFQVLENMAHLGDKGVLAFAERRRARLWLWSSRAWCLSTLLEGARLGREVVLRRREALAEKQQVEGDDGEKEAKIANAEDEMRWWAEVGVNAAYAPMTLHWSLEQGMLGDGVIGALGMVAGGLRLREAWRATA